MGETCDGQHVCDPEWYPQSLEEIWACPDCGKILIAVNVLEHMATMDLTPETRASVMSTVSPSTFGWSSR